MSANEKQIGGSHYKSGYQHWDWVVDANLGYLEGNATAYICRWKSKDGVKDLEKAAHYIEKLIEVHTERAYLNQSWSNSDANTSVFIDKNNFDSVQSLLLTQISGWKNLTDLELIKECLEAYITCQRKKRI